MNERLFRTKADHNDIARIGVSAWVALWLHVFGAGFTLLAIVFLQIPACLRMETIPRAMAEDSEVTPPEPELAFEMEVIELPPEPPEPVELAEAPVELSEEVAEVEPAPPAMAAADEIPSAAVGRDGQLALESLELSKLLAEDAVLGALVDADAGAADLASVFGDASGSALDDAPRGLLAARGTDIGLGIRGEGPSVLGQAGGGTGAIAGLGSLDMKALPELRARAALAGTGGAIAPSVLKRALRSRFTRLARCIQDATPPGTVNVVELSLTFVGSRLTEIGIVPPDPDEPDEAAHPGSERCALQTLRGLTLPSDPLDDHEAKERRATLRLSLTHPDAPAETPPAE